MRRLKKKTKDKQSFKRIFSNNFLMFKYILKFTPGFIVWSVLSSALDGAGTVVNGIYIAKVVLDAIEKDKSFVSLIPFLIGILLLNVLIALVQGLYDGSYYPRKKEYLYGKIHEELFQKAREMELACYDNPEFYNDFVWAMSESDEKALDVLDNLRGLVECLTVLGGSFAIIVSIDWLGIVVAAALLFVSWFVQKKRNNIQYALSLVQKPLQRKRDYTSRIMYQAEYAKEVRLSNVEEILEQNFCDTNENLIKEVRKFGLKEFAYGMFDDVFWGILLYGGYLGYLLYRTIVLHLYSYGDLWALFAGTDEFVDYWNGLIYNYARFRKNSLYIEKFRKFIEYEPAIKDTDNAISVPKTEAAITLEHVSFSYEGADEPTIKDISLVIHPGEKIALVGFNGAGKTTLIKLIMRLYDVTSGKILLGEKDIRDLKLSEYRNCFGVVFQDYQLLAATIGENVMMDIVNESDENKIEEALEKSGFKEKLDTLSKGTKTNLTREFDKEGVNLSGGEGQKVAIARVFPRDCKVVILDEPSSALDPISEYNVNQSMLEAAKDKTVLFISHRLSTTKVADRIIMLEEGRIIEEGSHDELMKLGGKYAEMYNLQAEKYREQS